MRTRSVLVLLSLFVCPALATFRIDMYLSDGNTPLPLRDPNVPNDYRDIMVGTQLRAIVSSDIATFRQGCIAMLWEDFDEKGQLFGKGYNADADTYDGSVLDAAGYRPSVRYSEDSNGIVYDFDGGRKSGRAGQWFIWDYNVIGVGDCNVILVDGVHVGVSPFSKGAAAMTLTLHHVPSRDFDGDSLVDFKDFAILARRWRTLVPPDANAVPSPFDLDRDEYVTVSDLRAFSRFWLNSTVARIAPPDPNSPPTDPQP
jgi:hypothetical protein